MNEKFLKERYDEWAGRYEFIYPGTPRGNELLAKADKRSSSMIAEMFEKVEKVENSMRWNWKKSVALPFWITQKPASMPVMRWRAICCAACWLTI